MKYTYTAVFAEKGGKVYARVPDLGGCITTGKGLQIPEPTPQSKIVRENGEALSLVNADTLKSL